jgi:hypothetical protein
MQVHHVLFFLVILVGGYVAGRLWAAPAKLVGLP